jgi:glyoxylase-like metal-dependent hydrolase (beta-lactamase superfamily II)
MSIARALAIVAITVGLTACSSAPTARQLGQDAIAAMGGIDRVQGVKTLTMNGGVGTRFRHGQTVKVGDVEPAGMLKNVVETLDRETERAALDYELQIGPFGQHRREILTKFNGRPIGLEDVAGRPLAVMSPSGLFSWGTQNHPEFLLKRNVIAVALAASGLPDDAPQDKTFEGRTLKSAVAKLPSGEQITVYFEPESKLIAGFDAVDTESMLGDAASQYVFADYKDVGGLKLPHKITIRKLGQPYSEVQYASASVNDAGAERTFTIPASATEEAMKAITAGEYSPLALTRIADGVYFARAYSHNSMVIEFPSWLAVVEAAYTDAQSATLARVLNEQFSGKPIRYAIATHHHYDHTGGVRGLAAVGATILAAKGHEPELRMIVETPHTNPPDALENAKKSGKAGALKIFDGKLVLSEGKQTLELYTISGNPHVEPKVLAYVPSVRALFQSDIWFPGLGAPAGPDAAHLLQSIDALKLPVAIHVGGHGGVGPHTELVKAVAASAAPASSR